MKALEKIPTWIRWPLSVIVFWIILLFAPPLFNIINFITTELFAPGPFTYWIILFLGQPFMGFLACVGAYKVAPKQNFIIVIVNATIACMLLLIMLISAICSLNWKSGVVYLLTIVALIIACVTINAEQKL